MGWIDSMGYYVDTVDTEIEVNLDDPEIIEYVLNKAGVAKQPKQNPLSELLW